MKYSLILFLPWLFGGTCDDTNFSAIFVLESLERLIIRHDNNIARLAFFDLFIDTHRAAVTWTMNALAAGCKLHNEPFSFDTMVCLNKLCRIN